MDRVDQVHFYAQLLKLIDGSVNDDEIRWLEGVLRSSEQARKDYSEFMQEYLLTKDTVGTVNLEENALSLKQLFDDQMWSQLARHEKNAPQLVTEKPQPPKEPRRKNNRLALYRRVNRASFLFTLTSMAALFVIVVGALLMAPQPARRCAVLKDSLGARWAAGTEEIAPGDMLYNRDEGYVLTSGIAKISFDYGAEVIIEGPASFTCRTGEELFLRSGKAYARVPTKATGFSVDTPWSKIVDLGTEFGVQVNARRATEVHMLKGKAALIPGFRGRKGSSINIEAGRAARVDRTGQVEDIDLEQSQFVRRMSSEDRFVWRGDPPVPGHGLIIHLHADSLNLEDGAPVMIWPDSATNDTVDGTVKADLEAAVPTFKVDGYNGFPAIHFDGTAKQALISDLWNWDESAGVTVVLLCTGGDESRNRVVHIGDIDGMRTRAFACDVSSNTAGESNTGSGVRYNNGYSLTGGGIANPVVHGQWQVSIRQLMNGEYHGDVFYSVDGTTAVTPLVCNEPHRTLDFSRSGNVIAVGNGRLDGKWIVYNDPYTGDVAEVLVYNRRLTTEEQRLVLRYFREKYDHRPAGAARLQAVRIND